MAFRNFIECERSPYVRESTKALDSGSIPDPSIWILDFNPLDSGFQPSGFVIPYQSGFRIPNHCGFRILLSGFRILKQKFAGFRIPDSLTWGEKGLQVYCFTGNCTSLMSTDWMTYATHLVAISVVQLLISIIAPDMIQLLPLKKTLLRSR